jgi:hypothetical protein
MGPLNRTGSNGLVLGQNANRAVYMIASIDKTYL